MNNGILPHAKPLIVLIERDLFELITSSVVYQASGTEPWTRCRLSVCNVKTDPSCCRACGECIGLAKSGNEGAKCNCGLAHSNPEVAGECRSWITATMGGLVQALENPQAVTYDPAVFNSSTMAPRAMFEALREPVLSFYGSNYSTIHFHHMFRRGLTIETGSRGSRWAQPQAMVAAVAAEMLRFLLSEWPHVARLHNAVRPIRTAWSCSLRLCLSQFTASSDSYDLAIERILDRAGVQRADWPRAKTALAKEDTNRYPRTHSTAKVLSSDMRGKLQSTVETLDTSLLHGFFARHQSEAQRGYGYACKSPLS